MDLIDAGGLDDAAVLGDVAVEHRQAAVLAEIGMLQFADDAVLRSRSSFVPAALLAEGDLGRNTARTCPEEIPRFRSRSGDVPAASASFMVSL
jgi:hypothetical protein